MPDGTQVEIASPSFDLLAAVVSGSPTPAEQRDLDLLRKAASIQEPRGRILELAQALLLSPERRKRTK